MAHAIPTVDIAFPRVEHGDELSYELEVVRGDVVPFSRVRRYIEEVKVHSILHELPGSRSYGSLRRRTLPSPEQPPLDEW